jgi:hypothetical protein
MAVTFYRIKQGSHGETDAESTKEIQRVLQDAAPGEYPIDIITADSPGSAGSARHWGKAIKHAVGAIHLESDEPGD